MQLLTVETKTEDAVDTQYAELHDLQKWELAACPVSTNDIATDYLQNNWLVFETESRIVQMKLGGSGEPSREAEPETRTRQKNPSIAFSSDGYKLIAWGEGVSFTRGGTLNWQLFDNEGNPVPRGNAPDAGAYESDLEASARGKQLLPVRLSISQNYPNPFNSRTMISYHLPSQSDVELSIYDLSGMKVATLVHERQAAARYEIEWYTQGMKPGIYFCELRSGQNRLITKMLMI
jgi:hypothetical protein